MPAKASHVVLRNTISCKSTEDRHWLLESCFERSATGLMAFERLNEKNEEKTKVGGRIAGKVERPAV